MWSMEEALSTPAKVCRYPLLGEFFSQFITLSVFSVISVVDNFTSEITENTERKFDRRDVNFG